MHIKSLIESIVEEEFAKAPKMGDIDPTEEPDSERPAMSGRPDSGMDMSQQHKMMHAESWNKITYGDHDDIEDLLTIVRQRIGFGQSLDDIVTELGEEFEVEDIVLTYRASKLLNKYEDEEDAHSIHEMSAVSAGGASMTSTGQIAGGPAGPGFSSNKKAHEMMWSGDKPRK